MQELRYYATLINDPWQLVGDFNLIRWLIDRSTGSRNFELMELFNDLIADLGVIDVPVHNRAFTWTNKWPLPTLSKLDRVFLSTEWSTSYPAIALQALDIIVSDHTPLLLTCKGLQQHPKKFRVEVFWFKYRVPKEMVRLLWEGNPTNRSPINSFHNRTMLLHRSLRLWHSDAFGNMQKQLDFCRDSILFFDRIEEQRPLENHEFQTRLKIKERAFHLANNIELKWKQRSRCNWLSNEDRNSKFFHAFASSRLRRNLVVQIQEGDQTTTDPVGIKEIFANSMQDVLGTSSQVLPFNAAAIYEPNPILHNLQDNFTMEEIENAVKQLANNKASGLDGLPNEFLKIYWTEIRGELLQIFNDFYDHKIQLQPFNEARIMMVPKIASPATTSDYRPISVLSLLPKLISKVLSNRLRTMLPQLISPNQTAFVHGRQISENFVSTREILQHVSAKGNPAIFAKIDFKKAFDTVEWSFLVNVMRTRGFPKRWIVWMNTIWNTSSSKVSINGEDSEPFTHKRGLRQGDPLSPMLFIIAVDVFQRMVNAANETLEASLSNKLTVPILALQYADDTTIVASADIDTLITFKLVLRLFTNVSGLQVNFSKSVYIPINTHEEDSGWIHSVIGFTCSHFPITYLGMPLSINRPPKASFLPLIERIESRLQGWQSKLLSRGGRMELIQSVLSTIPLYFMTCFLLPKWVIDRIDKARRSFLWAKTNGHSRAISLCN